MREFDMDMIRLITTFENITGTQVRDCINDNSICFLVEDGKAALAIGKNGQNVKIAERMLGKPIKIFEHSNDEIQFIKNLVPQAKKIEKEGNDVIKIFVDSKQKGSLIGKEGSNIRIIKKLVERNTSFKDVKIV